MTERDNQNRLSQAPPPENIPKQLQQQINSNPAPQQNLQFAVPTEFVELPSGGKYYPEGHPLKNKTSIEIKFMTAKEEDILASTNLIKKGVVFERLLHSVMVDHIDPNDLLIGDKNAILISSRINGYGPEYKTDIKCPSCSDLSSFTFDLSELKPDVKVDQQFRNDMNVEETDNGTFVIKLARIGKTIEVRPLNGHDEKRLSFMTNAKSKNNFVESVVTDSLKAYIVSVDGDSNPAVISAFVDTLPARESRLIRTIYKHIIPKIEFTSLYSCANCGHEQELEVPINTNFFWPDE